MLVVEGLHLSQYTLCELNIFIDSIIKSSVIEGSYCVINKILVDDIRINPHKYHNVFYNVANLKILNYLVDCNRLDTTPYKCEYSLINHFDMVITPFANQNRYINSLLKENGLNDVTCGTVHAFQGDEKDVILFSLAITDKTGPNTYEWLKNNKELINVATSRAKEQLIVLSSAEHLNKLHTNNSSDDVYDLVNYVKNNGEFKVAEKSAVSRALGVKPYTTETEEAFLISLEFALDNVLYNKRKCIVHKEVSIAHVFQENTPYNDLFYSGRFDFVVYERVFGKREIPILAIELDGKEHIEDEIVRERDRKKNEICKQHGFELIRIENSYARRYNYIKDILIDYFMKN